MDAVAARRLLAREVKRVLVERGWTQREASEVLGVTREQVNRWSKGRIPVHRLADLAEKSGVPVILELGTTKEAASPKRWGRRLREDVAQVTDLLAELAEFRAADDGAEAATSQLPADERADDHEAGGRDAAQRPRRPHQ